MLRKQILFALLVIALAAGFAFADRMTVQDILNAVRVDENGDALAVRETTQDAFNAVYDSDNAALRVKIGNPQSVILNIDVAELPSSPSEGDVVIVGDGASPDDCATGGGSSVVMCRYNGAAWVAIGGEAAGAVGTIASQDADDVAITGGAIDGASIGGETPAAGAFTTLAAGTDPTDEHGVGDRGYNDGRYLQSEVDGSTSNEINTVTGDDENTTSGLAITISGGSGVSTTVVGDVVTVSGDAASDESPGIVEFATQEEAEAATAPDLAVTPASLAGLFSSLEILGQLGEMSLQDADDVAISGGAIDGTTIGGTTPADGSFSEISVLAAGAPIFAVEFDDAPVIYGGDAEHAFNKTYFSVNDEDQNILFQFLGEGVFGEPTDLDEDGDASRLVVDVANRSVGVYDSDFIIYEQSGASFGIRSISELVTIGVGAGSAGVTTSTNMAPVGLIKSVAFYVVDAPGGGATVLDIGITGGDLDGYIDGASCDVLGEDGDFHRNGAFAYPVINRSATTLTLTTDGDVSGDQMQIRVVTFYEDTTPPTE